MEFRVEKRAIALITILLLSPTLFAQRLYQYEARKGGDRGILTINETEISFQETHKRGKAPKHLDGWRWSYQDIQQLKISAKSLSLLTYKSNKWKLGADREYEFALVSNKTFQDAYSLLEYRLEQRFVAEVAEHDARILWEIPAKHLRRFGGDDGVLRVGTDAIVYSSQDKDASRTWRYHDIDNISSSGPFQLTITTFERAKMDYGNRKLFNFQLKQRLEESRYNDLWLRLNLSKGLKILSSYR
jgi:hypothetical protein